MKLEEVKVLYNGEEVKGIQEVKIELDPDVVYPRFTIVGQMITEKSIGVVREQHRHRYHPPPELLNEMSYTLKENDLVKVSDCKTRGGSVRFNLGDRVKIPSDCALNFDDGYTVGVVTLVNQDGEILRVQAEGDSSLECDDHDYELISKVSATKESNMNVVPPKINKLLSDNQRAFYKLHYIDDELNLTSRGQDALLEFLFEQNEDAFGTVAKAKVKEIEAAEKEAK